VLYGVHLESSLGGYVTGRLLAQVRYMGAHIGEGGQVSSQVKIPRHETVPRISDDRYFPGVPQVRVGRQARSGCSVVFRNTQQGDKGFSPRFRYVEKMSVMGRAVFVSYSVNDYYYYLQPS
jgi:hypothetical protein